MPVPQTMRSAVGVAFALALAGCGDDGPVMAEARGTVLYNGQPLPNANVLFMPEGGGPASVGDTGPDGRFELTSSVRPGAVVGKHKVAVQKVEGYLLKPSKPGEPPADDEPSEGDGDLRYGRRWLIPQTYGNHISSGLSAEVTSDGENDFSFELKGPPPRAAGASPGRR